MAQIATATAATILPPSLLDRVSHRDVSVEEETRSVKDLSHEVAADDDEDASSVDTQDAFLDMLGLKLDDPNEPGLSSVLVMDEEEIDVAKEEEERRQLHQENRTIQSAPTSPPVLLALPIALPPKCSRYGHTPQDCAAVVVPNFWPRAECDSLLQLARHRTTFDYITHASHTSPDGSYSYQVQLQHPNPHKLAVLEDAVTIDTIWQRLLTHCHLCQAPWMQSYQRRTNYGPPVGLNPRLRVLQYDAQDNDRFEPHFDATTHVGDKTSRITVLLYLNDGGGVDFEGGETLYLDSHISNHNTAIASNATIDKHTVKIVPQAGTLVMFEHDLYHSGAPLQWGTKHVMRTDILFDNEDMASNNNGSPTSEAANSNSNNSPSNGSDDDKLPLVRDLCRDLQWSGKEQSVLEDMGLLDSTLDNLLVPGRSLLQAMLQDSGSLSTNRVQAFVTTAMERVQQQT